MRKLSVLLLLASLTSLASSRWATAKDSSPVVDGDLIYAYFRSGDLACVDPQGEDRWKTNLQESFGEDTLWWDLGSSPLLSEQAIVVAVMQTGPSYLVAFDKKSGRQLWKTDRMVASSHAWVGSIRAATSSFVRSRHRSPRGI